MIILIHIHGSAWLKKNRTWWRRYSKNIIAVLNAHRCLTVGYDFSRFNSGESGSGQRSKLLLLKGKSAELCSCPVV